MAIDSSLIAPELLGLSEQEEHGVLRRLNQWHRLMSSGISDGSSITNSLKQTGGTSLRIAKRSLGKRSMKLSHLQGDLILTESFSFS